MVGYCGLIIIVPYFKTLYMIKSSVFGLAITMISTMITQHSTIWSHGYSNYSDVYTMVCIQKNTHDCMHISIF